MPRRPDFCLLTAPESVPGEAIRTVQRLELSGAKAHAEDGLRLGNQPQSMNYARNEEQQAKNDIDNEIFAYAILKEYRNGR